MSKTRLTRQQVIELCDKQLTPEQRRAHAAIVSFATPALSKLYAASIKEQHSIAHQYSIFDALNMIGNANKRLLKNETFENALEMYESEYFFRLYFACGLDIEWDEEYGSSHVIRFPFDSYFKALKFDYACCEFYATESEREFVVELTATLMPHSSRDWQFKFHFTSPTDYGYYEGRVLNKTEADEVADTLLKLKLAA